MPFHIFSADIQKNFFFFLLAVPVLLLHGCGYTNPYSPSASDEGNPESTVSIFVDMWENQTSEMGYQSDMKQSLVQWLKKSRRFTLTKNRGDADYLLGGVIKSAHFPGLSYGNWDRAVEVRAEISFSFYLKKRESGETVLENKHITRRESFLVGGDASATETNKRRALLKIADELADNIYIQLYYRFSQKES
ncbi:MAG: hypothetical protein KQH63_05735 [Desulfobulbaceae bacterium]|nr:hypothetical protein [Desulfobulbaceae bacterium]